MNSGPPHRNLWQYKDLTPTNLNIEQDRETFILESAFRIRSHDRNLTIT